MGCAIGHNVLVHHLDPLLSVEFQAGLHEVQRRCNVAGTHDARDHHPSRGDATKRSDVSSSSSASIFEVLRDSQILGSDTLKLSGAGEKMTMFPQAEECSKMCRKPDSMFLLFRVIAEFFILHRRLPVCRVNRIEKIV